MKKAFFSMVGLSMALGLSMSAAQAAPKGTCNFFNEKRDGSYSGVSDASIRIVSFGRGGATTLHMGSTKKFKGDSHAIERMKKIENMINAREVKVSEDRRKSHVIFNGKGYALVVTPLRKDTQVPEGRAKASLFVTIGGVDHEMPMTCRGFKK